MAGLQEMLSRDQENENWPKQAGRLESVNFEFKLLSNGELVTISQAIVSILLAFFGAQQSTLTTRSYVSYTETQSWFLAGLSSSSSKCQMDQICPQ